MGCPVAAFIRLVGLHLLLLCGLARGYMPSFPATARGSNGRSGGSSSCPIARFTSGRSAVGGQAHSVCVTSPHIRRTMADGTSPSALALSSSSWSGGGLEETSSIGVSVDKSRVMSLSQPGETASFHRRRKTPLHARRVSALASSTATVAPPAPVVAEEEAVATAGAVAEEKAILDPPKKQKMDKKARQAAAGKALEVHVIGLSHHNAAVEVREKLAVPEAEWNAHSEGLVSNPHIQEAATLSTCNRFEIYVACHDSRAGIREAINMLCERSGLSQSVLRQSLFMLSGEDAVWHLLRVSAGLDSLVVGEGQILSQVRQCYIHGTEEDGRAGKVVSRLLNTAVSAGKRVRSETSISKGAVSISSAAVEFSNLRAFKDTGRPFLDSKLAIIGAGTMSRLLLVHMSSLGVKKVILVNRSMPRCTELMEEFPDMEFDVRVGGGEADLEQAILEADILYTSTNAPACIVTKEQLARLGAGKDKPVMFLDISVPRNVESGCDEIEGVSAYDVDDLKMVVAKNTALRRREMMEAEGILEEEQLKFRGWQQSLSAIPAISKMQEKFEGMRQTELKKASSKLSNLSDKEREVVEKISRGIVNKMLHGPMSALRAPEGPESKKQTIEMLKGMFRLGDKGL